MSAIIESCAGVVHVITQQTGGGGGFLKLLPDLPEASDGGRCVIRSTPITLREIVQPSVTLDDTRKIYVFGSAWAEGNVTGLMLLGRDGAGGGALAAAMRDWYDTNRISKKKSDPLTISVADAHYSAYLTGMAFGETNPDNNTQGFTLTFLISLD